MPQGYGWVFPKHDHWSVGVYTLSRRVPDLRRRFLAYLRETGLASDDESLSGMEAFRIPVGGFRLRTLACPPGLGPAVRHVGEMRLQRG